MPAAAGHFTGRRSELDLISGLDEAARPAGAVGGTVMISAIDGMAGVGKTALAVHSAHRLADRFPDGQLFIDLHGYSQDQPPREPAEALPRCYGRWACRRPDPGQAEECAGLYRQRLAGTRTLIVLDNARSEAQVRRCCLAHQAASSWSLAAGASRDCTTRTPWHSTSCREQTRSHC